MEEKEIIMEQPKAAAQVTEVIDKEKVAEVLPKKYEDDGAYRGAEGSIGKFKNTESLLNAYNSLQAEFTRKCQKLSELEEAAKVEKSADEYIKENPHLVEEILKKYIQEVQSMPTPPTISSSVGSGIPLMAPPQPTTLDEAREAVKNLFR